MKLTLLAVATLALAAMTQPAAATTCPAFTYNYVLTAAQWQACFDAKQNTLGYAPVNKAGDVMTGRLVLPAPTGSKAQFNLTPGAAPTSPVDGDVWMTSTDVQARNNGATFSLIAPNIANIAGLGTGVATALGVNVGSAGAFVVNGGALGTPSSGVATNLTGTAAGLTAGHVTTNADLTGDVTSVGNATTIAANAVTNAKLATMGAYTLKGNATGSTAVPTDVSVPALTAKATPAAADIVLIHDSAASNAFKRTTVGGIVGTGVSSYNGRTGAVTGAGIDIPLRSYIAGLTLSAGGSTATFGITAGVATDSTNAQMMLLGSSYSKSTSAWAVGSGNGALDTGTIAANTWYHAFLIRRPDTGVVDVQISLSPSAPALPPTYTQFRRIGSLLTDASSNWTSFSQDGDQFLWGSGVVSLAAAATSASASSVALAVPTGVVVNALMTVRLDYVSAATSTLISALVTADIAPLTSTQTMTVTSTSTQATGQVAMRTDTSRSIRVRSSGTGANLSIFTYGWVDRRGRDN